VQSSLLLEGTCARQAPVHRSYCTTSYAGLDLNLLQEPGTLRYAEICEAVVSSSKGLQLQHGATCSATACANAWSTLRSPVIAFVIKLISHDHNFTTTPTFVCCLFRHICRVLALQVLAIWKFDHACCRNSAGSLSLGTLEFYSKTC
jgi:hypothetical protein